MHVNLVISHGIYVEWSALKKALESFISYWFIESQNRLRDFLTLYYVGINSKIYSFTILAYNGSTYAGGLVLQGTHCMQSE